VKPFKQKQDRTFLWACTIFSPWFSYANSIDRLHPNWGLANKKSSRVKGSKVWLIYLLTSNIDGLEKLPPLIIEKTKKP
jgi:hypothetical protein